MHNKNIFFLNYNRYRSITFTKLYILRLHKSLLEFFSLLSRELYIYIYTIFFNCTLIFRLLKCFILLKLTNTGVFILPNILFHC